MNGIELTGSTLMFRVLASFLTATSIFALPLAAQDPIWEHQQHVEAQQAEERRMNEIANQLNQDVTDMQAADPGQAAYAPNSFVSFPPDAWNDWVKYHQEQHSKEVEDRLGRDPGYRLLLKGVWSYRSSPPGQLPNICAATFWTRNGEFHLSMRAGKRIIPFWVSLGLASLVRTSRAPSPSISSSPAMCNMCAR